jgi:hypothetical protein
MITTLSSSSNEKVCSINHAGFSPADRRCASEQSGRIACPARFFHPNNPRFQCQALRFQCQALRKPRGCRQGQPIGTGPNGAKVRTLCDGYGAGSARFCVEAWSTIGSFWAGVFGPAVRPGPGRGRTGSEPMRRSNSLWRVACWRTLRPPPCSTAAKACRASSLPLKL